MAWKALAIAIFVILLEIVKGQSSPTVFAVGPNVFRIDAEETVSLVSFKLEKPIQVSVFLQDHPHRKKTYSEKTVSLEPYKPQTVKLKISSSDLSDEKVIEEGKSRYLYLVVQSNDATFKFKKESVLLVEPSSGHVFIQTDKPIYSPRQTVYIRVLPVDQQLMLTNIPVRLEILNPQEVVVERRGFRQKNGFISHTHDIIDRPLFGNWTIRASYGKDNKSSNSVQFEIREYLLPMFEVKVKPHLSNFILPETQELQGSVTARYVFGKPVKGFVVLTISVDFLGKLTTPWNLKLEEGEAHFNLKIDDLLQPLGVDGHPDGGRLVMRADVTERATFQTETEEDRSCVFVRSPFVLSLTRSSSYMKPGLFYNVRIDARYFGGGVVSDLPVKVKTEERDGQRVIRSDVQEIKLNAAGQGKLQVDLLRNSEALDITVKSNDEQYPDESQASIVHTVRRYASPSNSYLIVRVNQDVVQVDQPLKIEMFATKIDDISTLNILLLSRGHVVHAVTLNRDVGLVTTTTVTVTPAMVPSIRVLAYYINSRGGGGPEVVADSVLIDVEDSCSKEVVITSNQEEYEPGSNGVITLRGEPDTLVGLSMVDSAVFLLNDRHILSRKKMFDTLETFDLGCGPGGGKNGADVFFETGLSVVSTTAFTNVVRDSRECRNPAHNRRRREAEVPKAEIHEFMCCREGLLVLNETTCYKRANELVNATNLCKQKFYECCKKGACRKQKDGCSRTGRVGEAAGLIFPNMFDIPDNVDVPVRANFPESTFFENYKIGPAGEKRLQLTLPSSITKWMVQGISVSPSSGMCVANPKNITVFKTFFLDVRLPVKAVRGEQLEVQVTVYNFGIQDVRAVVYLYGVTGLCSAARAGERTPPRRMLVPKNDAVSTSYPIVPLENRQYKIKVVAYSILANDAVEKVLYVVPEGKRVEKPYTIPLDPQGRLKAEEPQPGVQNDQRYNEQGKTSKLELTIPPDIIENTASCSAHVTGSVMGHSVQAVVDGLEGMLRQPTGCGEQTMIRMAPTVYAMTYLTHTNPNRQGVENKGYKFIEDGYNRELKYRKADGSFAVWANRPSSTWLTAFVLKVFCQSREFIDIDNNVISTGFNWLSKQQTKTGQYKEAYKVHHQEMIGNVKDGLTLTAFVLIALKECYPSKADKVPGEVKAIEYLEGQLNKVESPYALSLITYALVLADSKQKNRANELLRAKAFYDKDNALRYWSEGKIGKKAPALAVETTSYALLAQLKLGDVKYTHAIINWLIQQRNSKGAFVSTQDTVIGLQAITEYSVETFSEDLDMTCDLKSEADGQFHESVHLVQKDAEVQRTVKNVPIGGNLVVHTRGSGVGQLHVQLGYNVPTDGDELCRFDMKIECKDIKFKKIEKDKECDVCGQNCKDIGGGGDDYDYDDVDLVLPNARAGAPVGMAYVGKKRSRIGRQAARIPVLDIDKGAIEDGGNKKVVCIHFCASSLTGKDTGMSIIDIGLFTGLTALENDLQKLKDDNVVDDFEAIGERVIFYVQKIPQKDEYGEPLCVKFRARQDHYVGNVQPQTVKVYDYYEPEDTSCTRFYRPQEQSGLYQTLCEGGMCKCAEGHCTKHYTNQERWAIKKNDLLKIACTEADYVYIVKPVTIEEKGGMGLAQRKVTADLRSVIKPGGDPFAVENESIEFWIVSSCPDPQLEKGRLYLIMGKDGKIDNDKMKYRLDDHAFVMEFYDRNNRALPKKDRIVGHHMLLMRKTLANGCPNK
ncbi:LOW QUALITY PROTEIN: complement C3-like [Liolophura sinensis]|uniref:LOW QUALITY PROTEIN: complement C3-like n=1 Tax=Liolophura sinensis TaxID=3198878 RepID=UPI0031585FA1